MKKNRIQIEHYLKNKTYVSESDFKAIRAYCLNERNLKVRESKRKEFREDDRITCADFLEWENSGLEAGTVVKWDDFLGIVYNSNPKYVQICFKTHRNTPNFDFQYVPVQDIQTVDESVSESVYELLWKEGKEFGANSLEIIDKYVPRTDDIVEFQKIGPGKKKKCYGVVHNVVEGEVWMYCYIDGEGKLHYSDIESIGRLECFQFVPADTVSYARKKLESCLNAVGKSWNHGVKRVEPKGMRAASGEKYWYIDDKLNVKCAVDEGKQGTTAHKRYIAGNYSRDRERCQMLQVDISDLAKKYLAEPEE